MTLTPGERRIITKSNLPVLLIMAKPDEWKHYTVLQISQTYSTQHKHSTAAKWPFGHQHNQIKSQSKTKPTALKYSSN